MVTVQGDTGQNVRRDMLVAAAQQAAGKTCAVLCCGHTRPSPPASVLLAEIAVPGGLTRCPADIMAWDVFLGKSAGYVCCFASLLQVQHPCDVVEAGCLELKARLSVPISASAPYCITLLHSILLTILLGRQTHTPSNRLLSWSPWPQMCANALEASEPTVCHCAACALVQGILAASIV